MESNFTPYRASLGCLISGAQVYRLQPLK